MRLRRLRATKGEAKNHVVEALKGIQDFVSYKSIDRER